MIITYGLSKEIVLILLLFSKRVSHLDSFSEFLKIDFEFIIGPGRKSSTDKERLPRGSGGEELSIGVSAEELGLIFSGLRTKHVKHVKSPKSSRSLGSSRVAQGGGLSLGKLIL